MGLGYALFETFRHQAYRLALVGVAFGIFLFSFGVAWFVFRKTSFPIVAFGATMAWSIIQFIYLERRKRKQDKEVSQSKHIIIVMRRSSYFGIEMKEAIDKTIRKHVQNVSIEVWESNEDVDTQINNLVQARRSRPDVIILFPTKDEPRLVDAVVDAIKDRITVITVDRHLPRERFRQRNLQPPFHVASDFHRGGQIAAEMMLDKLHKKGNIAIISGPEDAQVSRIRLHAFIGKILEDAPNVRIIYCRYTTWEQKEGKQRAKEIMRMLEEGKVESVDGIFCCSDGLALGAAEVIKDSKVTIIGYDGIKQVRSEIREGKIYGTVDVRIEGQAVRLANELLKIFKDKEGYLDSYKPPDLIEPHSFTLR